MIQWSDFEKIEMRVGTIIAVDDFPKAKNASFKLTIDFGSFGIKRSSAQITTLYDKSGLIGQQIIAVINFPPKQIADMMSECLVLGAIGENKDVTLLTTHLAVDNGLRIG